MQTIYRFVIILACALVFPLAASSQERTYDFSLTFSGLPSVGGDSGVEIFGTVTFDGRVLSSSDLSISAFDGSSISFSDAGYSFTGTLGDENTFDNFSFSSVVNLPGNPSRDSGGVLYDNNVRTLNMTYGGSSPIFVSSERDPAGSTPSFFEGNNVLQYEFGGETVNAIDQTTLSGNDPVAVPEIKGGSLALILFILGTLSVFIASRRKPVVCGHLGFA